MRLVCLGTNGFLPTDQAQTACYFHPHAGILLDAGSGLYRLPAFLHSAPLDIYLSHAHIYPNSAARMAADAGV